MCSDGLRFFGVARMKPILYLIPTPLGAPDTPCLLPHEQQAIVGLTDFVVEAEKNSARAFEVFRRDYAYPRAESANAE